jgi:hypothetical protein
MSRFRLYGSGGRPVYDSDGEPEDRRLDRIKREFNAGVAMVYDPSAGLVRGQVKIHRRSPEQFVATYQTDGGADLLAGLLDNVRGLVDRREWTIQHGTGGAQAVYDALADGSAFEPEALAAVGDDLSERSIGQADIRDAVADAGAADLLVPDYATGAAALVYVRETFPEYAVAVTETTDVETIAGVDIVIRPDGGVDRVSPGPEFSRWLDRRRAAAATDALERAIESVAVGDADKTPGTGSESTPQSSDSGTEAGSATDPNPRSDSETGAASGPGAEPSAAASTGADSKIAAAVNRATPVSELGVRAVPPSESTTARSELRRTLTYGLPSGAVVGAILGVVWSGILGTGSVSGVLLAAGSILAGAVWAGALLAARLRDAPDPDIDAQPTDSAVTAIADAVSRLATVVGPDAARETLANTLDPYGIAVKPADEPESRRRRAVWVGVGASAGVGAVVLVAAAVLPSIVG